MDLEDWFRFNSRETEVARMSLITQALWLATGIWQIRNLFVSMLTAFHLPLKGEIVDDRTDR
jgi:hypothetical protein